MGLSEQDIELIVKQVMTNMNKDEKEQIVKVEKLKEIEIGDFSRVSTSYENGIFKEADEAIEAAFIAQKKFVSFSLEHRERIIKSIREMVLENKEYLAREIHNETNLGRYEHKVGKLELVANKTPGTEDLKVDAFTGDNGLTIVENGPFGVIGAITPVTNPVETIICNSIGIIASGNSVVFNVHPSGKKCSKLIVEMINKVVKKENGPENLITMIENPTMESVTQLTKNDKVRLLIGTGGPGLVKVLLSSGKKAIGAGAGNPPVIVDETADIENAAKEIIKGSSFDNNILCIAEKEVFAVNSICDDLIFHMLNNGAYMLSNEELEAIMRFALEENIRQEARGCSLDRKREYHVAKDWVGKDANLFLDKIGIILNKKVELLICEVDFDHPFVQLEQMMPLLPIVRTKDVDEAIDFAVKAEHGNRHTAMMHSKNIENLTKFAKSIETTIFVKNASSLAGVGANGEGYTTMSIAGPTGEGLVSAKNFVRKRRCVLAEGGFRIV